MPSPANNFGTIDRQSPINWAHSLNRGLVSWWLAAPGFSGGKTWFDLNRASHNDATLSAFNSGNGWRGTNRRGGFQNLSLNGASSGYAGISSVTRALFTSGYTLAAWVNPNSLSSDFQIINQWINSGDGLFVLKLSSSTGKPFANVSIAGSEKLVNASSVAATVGVWSRVVATWDGSLLRVYVNGVADGSTAAASGVPTTSSDALNIGAYTPGSVYANGLIDDVRILNRAWRAAEVSADYSICLAGYPGVLNRVNNRRFAASSAATGFPWWALRGGILGTGMA